MAVRIPKNVAEAAKLRPGDHLELSVEGSGTVRIRKKKGTSKLRDLVREITAANLHTETDWGARRRQRTVVAREYVPDAGDLIWLDFTPQAGREQAGRRPAVVLSRRSYNEKTCLAVVFRSEPPCEVAHPRRDSLRPFEKPRLAPAASPKGQ